MSKLKSDRKPPLAKSPIRLRPRQVLRPNTMQTPPGSLTKSQKLNRTRDVDELELRPEYLSISCELQALAKIVQDELGNGGTQKAGFATSPSAVYSNSLFERGRFYEEYSARRNERLRRKKGQTGEQGKMTYNLGVTVESAKRSSRKLESLRKSISAAYSVETAGETPRYMLRSMSKQNKKPPLAAAVYSDKSVAGTGGRKPGARRVRRN